MLDGCLLEARRLVVRYGATTALQDVSLDIRTGEVHAVVGENGAGKSTLLRAAAGSVRCAAGTIRTRAGTRLAWVPQEIVLPLNLTVAAWIFLAHELRGRLGWLEERAMQAGARAALRAIGCDVSPQAQIGTLAAPQRKQVQLARALREHPDLLLLDEPTAVLGEAETRELFRAVRRLQARGTGILYVSHRLNEVLAIADRVTVLRDGRHVSTDAVDAVDTAALVHRMVGREIPAHRRRERPAGSPVLHLTHVAVAHVHGASLTVHRGEVVGLAGLVGAGRSEVLEAVMGLRPLRGGHIVRAVAPALVPEDRVAKGLIPTLGVRENVCLPAGGWLLHPRRERRNVQRWIARLAIRCRGTEVSIDSLSGGNQQKLLLARILRRQPQLLLLDEPTAGVDIGAKAEIHGIIRRLADDGAAVLLVSSDLPELLVLCDRIVAMRAGRCVGEVAGGEASEPRLAGLITGASPGASPGNEPRG
jgi:ABC-type sugar transport system ATPase subunit